MRFRGEYAFLSNFYPVKLIAWGLVFPTAEHVYVASKTLDPLVREHISMISTPGQAKAYGRRLELRPGWEAIKIPIMLAILRRKFADPNLRAKLLKFEGLIVESNDWHDCFWGTCVCGRCVNREWQNWLGKLLMQVREELHNEGGGKR